MSLYVIDDHPMVRQMIGMLLRRLRPASKVVELEKFSELQAALIKNGEPELFVLGYAKPVPVDVSRLRHPKRDMVWVALAGPVANLLQAILWMVAIYFLSGFDVEERFFTDMAKAGVLTNLVMFAFNLFPIPPMDGGRIVVGLLPWRLAVGFAQVERFGFFIVMGLVLLGVVNALWMTPIMNASVVSIQWLLQPLAHLFLLTTP